MSNAASAASPLCAGSLDRVAARINKARRSIVAAIVAWFALGVSSSWLPTPDSALYLMLGRSLAQGHGYALDGRPHAYVPPGYPLFLAALERCGLGSMLSLNLAMGIIGLLSVWISYLLVCELASPPVAFVVASLLGFNSLLHVMSALQLSDMPFTLLVLVGLYGLVRGLRGEKWALEWGTLALLASCWVRLAGAALALACALGLFLQPRSTSRWRIAGNVAALVSGVALTLVAFYAQYQNSLRAQHSLPPASYMAGVQAIISQPVGTLLRRALDNAYESAAEIPKFLTGLQGNPIAGLAVCLSPALVGLWRRLKRREFLIALAVAGYAGGIVMNLPAGARYLLPVAPLLILYYLEGLSVLLDWHPRVRRLAGPAIFVFLAAFVAINGFKAAYVFYKNEHAVAEDRAEMADAAQGLRAQARPGEHFLSCHNEWQLAYLSRVPYMQLDRSLIARTMDRNQYLRFLFDQGVRLVVAVPENVSNYCDDALIREAVGDRHMFQHLMDNGKYRLYRYVSPPGVATVESAPPRRGALLQ